jgi:glycosyltransferase involved in cell wall biosynthesis
MGIRRKVTFLSRSSVIHRNHRMQFYETKMASEYLKQGWKVDILTTAFSSDQSTLVKKIYDSVQYVSFPGCEPDKYSPDYFTSTREWIEGKDNESDLIIGSSWAGLGLLDIKEKNICHVLHNSYSTNKKTRHLRKVVPQYIEWFMNTRKIVKSNQKIIAVSNELKNLIIKDYPLKINVHAVTNGISIPTAVHVRGTRDPKKAIFIGRLSPQKGIEHIIQAAGHLPEIKFYIHGVPQSEEYKYELTNSTRNLENVEINFNGLLPDQVWTEYSSATYSLHPTLVFEAFGYSLVEAMAMGCIPIASTSGAMKAVIEDAQNGYLFDHSGSVNSFIETLKRAIMTDADTCDSISRQAIATVEKKFTAEKHIQSINSLMLE